MKQPSQPESAHISNKNKLLMSAMAVGGAALGLAGCSEPTPHAAVATTTTEATTTTAAPANLPTTPTTLKITVEPATTQPEQLSATVSLQEAMNQAVNFHEDEVLNIVKFSVFAATPNSVKVTTSPDNVPGNNYVIPASGLEINNPQVIDYNNMQFLSVPNRAAGINQALFIELNPDNIKGMYMTELNNPTRMPFSSHTTPVRVASIDHQTNLPQDADGKMLVQLLPQQGPALESNSLAPTTTVAPAVAPTPEQLVFSN